MCVHRVGLGDYYERTINFVNQMPKIQDEFNDMGRAVDKPKGFVKWSLLAYWAAIISLSGVVMRLVYMNLSAANKCADKTEQIMATMQKSIDEIRVEYNKKLEERIARLENVEQRVDSLPKSKVK